LKNSWYAAGFSQELTDTPLLGRTILSEPVLLFRDEHGTAAAIGNRCPHRFAPLSMGTQHGGQVRCGYHGLGFDRFGRCIHNPHGPIGALSVPTYPVIEANGILWIWMGDVERAGAASLPPLTRIDDETQHVRRGYLHGQSHYELMSDNILDLSHIEFLHPSLGTEAVSRAKVEVTQQDGTITTTRRMRDEVLPAGLAYVYRSGETIVNRTMTVSWYPAAVMTLLVTVNPANDAENWQSSAQTLHLFTPETNRSTHYFYVGSLPRATADEERADRFFAALSNAFLTEDKPMIDAQAAMIGDADIMDLKPALLGIDKAAVLARRRLADLIAAEQTVNASR
jgi:vanillate O-demethylase monooxygenase subunit